MLQEHYTAAFEFDVKGNVRDRLGTGLDFKSITGVDAICGECNHCWRLRGVAQVTDLDLG